MNVKHKQYGFTIVELLIVIVVIAILASITIVAYNGVTSNARWTAKQALIKNITTSAEADQVRNGSYPSFNGSTPLTGLQNDLNTSYIYGAGVIFDSDEGIYIHCGTASIRDKLCLEPVRINGSSTISGYGVIAFNDTKGCWVGIAGTNDAAGLREYFTTVTPWMSPSVLEDAVSETPRPTQLSSFVASLDCKFGSGQYPVTDTAACPAVVPRPENLYGNLPSVC